MLRFVLAVLVASGLWLSQGCQGTVSAPVSDPATVSRAEPHPDARVAAASPQQQAKVEPSTQPVAPPSLLARLRAAKQRHGGLILFWGDRGIEARTPQLDKVAQLTSLPSRHPFITSDRKGLFYLATTARQVRHLSLSTGKDRLVAQLPPLQHRCFLSKSPFEQLQTASDIGWDEATGRLCFDIGDRNENMVSVKMNFRVDLETGQVRSAYTLVLDNCEERGAVESRRVCKIANETTVTARARTSPAREPATHRWPHLSPRALTKLGLTRDQLGNPSPSGRWFQFRDFDAQGDYIYSAILLFDAGEGVIYGINYNSTEGIPNKKRPFKSLDYARLKNRVEPPVGLCLVPVESSPSWTPWQDTFLLDGCVDGIAVFSPPGPIEVVPAAGFSFF